MTHSWGREVSSHTLTSSDLMKSYIQKPPVNQEWYFGREEVWGKGEENLLVTFQATWHSKPCGSLALGKSISGLMGTPKTEDAAGMSSSNPP